MILVAASDVNDSHWSNSNFAECVDIYAPGVKVLSAMDTSENATLTATGGSMAAARVSGVVAQYLQSNPAANITKVRY